MSDYTHGYSICLSNAFEYTCVCTPEVQISHFKIVFFSETLPVRTFPHPPTYVLKALSLLDPYYALLEATVPFSIGF